MKTQPTLLILAAGLSIRYGKLKQIDGFGPNGESIIDYTIYDAIRIGYKKVVIVLRKEFREMFSNRIDTLFGNEIEITYVEQDNKDLPMCYNFGDRKKPWGTAHAVWSARYHIKGHFVVVNADDFYGYMALSKMYNFCCYDCTYEYAVMTYYLVNTLSEHGGVNRGVCFTDGDGYLSQIREAFNITRHEDTYTCTNNINARLSHGTLVSMNMFAMHDTFFDICELSLEEFLMNYELRLNNELIITSVLDKGIKSGKIKVRTLNTNEKWFGVTFPQDKDSVEKSLKSLINNNMYPTNLYKQLTKSA